MTWDAEVAADSPRSWWRYDATSGTAVPDFGSSGNDGTLAGAIQQVGAPGHVSLRETDLAVRLPYVAAGPTNGSRDENETLGGYMEADPSLFGTPSAWTFEAVIWPDGPPGSPYALRVFTLAFDDGVDDGNLMAIDGETGAVNASVTNGTTSGIGGIGYYQAGGGEVCWTRWNHVAATYEAGVIKVFHQGEKVGESAVIGGLVYHPDRRLLIGRQHKVESRSKRWFDGKISEALMYNSALSEARIAAHAAEAPWCGATAGIHVGIRMGA